MLRRLLEKCMFFHPTCIRPCPCGWKAPPPPYTAVNATATVLRSQDRVHRVGFEPNVALCAVAKMFRSLIRPENLLSTSLRWDFIGRFCFFLSGLWVSCFFRLSTRISSFPSELTFFHCCHLLWCCGETLENGISLLLVYTSTRLGQPWTLICNLISLDENTD